MQDSRAIESSALVSEVTTRRFVMASLRFGQPLSLLALLLGMTSIGPLVPAAVYPVVAIALLAGAYRIVPRSDYRTFALYVLGFSVFNGLRTLADDWGYPVSYTYPIQIDAWVFGVNPSASLQGNLYQYQLGSAGLIGWAAIAVYATYFWAHYVAAVLIWWLRRELLEVYVKAILATLFIGLAVYYVLPTAPPWLASEAGDLPEVARIARVERNDLWADAYSRGSHIAGTNDVAAMPSLHTALTMVITLAAWRIRRRLGLIGIAYVAAMGFALVYLGEHYVVDVVAGVATAAVAWKLVLALEGAPRFQSMVFRRRRAMLAPAVMVREDSPEAA